MEDRLDEEKDLREQGLANNVETVEAELAEKKKARDEEIKQQEELQAKQANLARLQLVVDTAVQASNLITSATNIFKALSSIPFIGIPLAISTIALMTGAFVAAKVKAFQLVNDQKQSFGEGGYIDGPSHKQGGRKYRAIDGTGLVELEGGEYVTNRESTAKYGDLLEAINSNEIGYMDEDNLRDMLAGMGIRLSSSAPKHVIQVIRERDTAQEMIMLKEPANDISAEVKAINENVRFLAQKERERVERWEDEEYYYTKVGTRTTKIKKK